MRNSSPVVLFTWKLSMTGSKSSSGESSTYSMSLSRRGCPFASNRSLIDRLNRDLGSLRSSSSSCTASTYTGRSSEDVGGDDKLEAGKLDSGDCCCCCCCGGVFESTEMATLLF